VGAEWCSQSNSASIERNDLKLVVDRRQRIERQLFRLRVDRDSGIKCVFRSERNHEQQQLRRNFNSGLEHVFGNERNGKRGFLELGFGSGFKRFDRNERQCQCQRLRLRPRIGLDVDLE
jgi:hypothetical protein